jgi:hypothetical protein
VFQAKILPGCFRQTLASLQFCSKKPYLWKSLNKHLKKSIMEAVKGLSNLQLELLKLFAYPLPAEQLLEIKVMLSRYFAEKATTEMDRLWDENGWSNDTMQRWSEEHIRAKSEH